MNTTYPVILFDGVCNLCNSSVQFIIRHDRKERFRFASLQGQYAQTLLQQLNLPTTNFRSFILVENGRLFMESTAALRTFKVLGGAWSLLYACIIVPPFIRNAVYRLIAKNRYKWFGKSASCMVPAPGIQSRFLD